MTTEEFLKYMNSGKQVTAECGVHQTMHKLSQDAIRITMEINSRYHTPDEINVLMSELVGAPVEVGLFLPFYTDCGKNIHLGKGVFINAGCKFQDQGGIWIGDGALIGHNTVHVMKISELGATEDMIEGIADGTIILDGGYKVLDRDEVVKVLKASM